MKTLLINASDVRGGAARAAYRLHRGLEQVEINSSMLVQDKRSTDISVIGPKLIGWKGVGINYLFRFIVDKSPLLLYPKHQKIVWSPQWLPNKVHTKIDRLNPDIVHLHWICDGFVPISEVAKIKQPMIWTLHDMWPFTGGCHYNGTCDRYMHECGRCPQLGSDKEKDLSHWVWNRKKKFWADLDITIVTPSRWLANCARSSSLFGDNRVEMIPNGLDLQKFKPIDKSKARDELNLPVDKNLILFGAMKSTTDKRKGFQYLKSAINVLSDDFDFEAIVFGNSGKDGQLNTPVLFITFRRPDTTRKVFERIRQAQPKRLYIAQNFPGSDNVEEVEKWKGVRAIIENIDWDCDVQRLYREQYLDAKTSISTAINWFFENEEEGIILEDDCLPHPAFFRFCEELLDKYRDDKRIAMISGDNFQFGRKRTEYSYYFSRYTHIWGWASWRRAWDNYDVDMKIWPEIRDGGWLKDLLGARRSVWYWKYIFGNVYKGKVDT